MTRAEFEFFLLCSAVLCLVMAIFNVVRPKNRSFFLSGAFLSVAAALMLYRQGVDQSLVGVCGAIAFICMVADFMARARRQVLNDGGKK